jgi:hypothetical protein
MELHSKPDYSVQNNHQEWVAEGMEHRCPIPILGRSHPLVRSGVVGRSYCISSVKPHLVSKEWSIYTWEVDGWDVP